MEWALFLIFVPKIKQKFRHTKLSPNPFEIGPLQEMMLKKTCHFSPNFFIIDQLDLAAAHVAKIFFCV